VVSIAVDKNKIRNSRQVYRLLADPDKVTTGDTLKGWVLEFLVAAGGRMYREEMVMHFSKRLARRRPEVACRPTTLLSYQVRVLRDEKVLQVVNPDGTVVKTQCRAPTVRK
jgi:hypothetical protein